MPIPTSCSAATILRTSCRIRKTGAWTYSGNRTSANDDWRVFVLRWKHGSAHALHWYQSQRGLLEGRGRLHLQRCAISGDQENVPWPDGECLLYLVAFSR